MNFDLISDGPKHVSVQILRLFTQAAVKDPEHFMMELERACEVSSPIGTVERRFLDWGEAREMQQLGMAFGSHTHSHEILTKLSPEMQREEAFAIRERYWSIELNRRVRYSPAYPVGLKH